MNPDDKVDSAKQLHEEGIDSDIEGPLGVKSDPLEMISELRELITVGFATSNGLIDARLTATESKDKIIDQLHGELQQHRRNLHLQLIKPLLSDLVVLHDDLSQMAGFSGNDEPANKAFASFAEAVEEILARNGVEPYQVPGDEVDRKRQRVIQTDPTGDPALAGRVARRLRSGFALQDVVIRPEMISTWKVEPSLVRDTPPTEEPQELASGS